MKNVLITGGAGFIGSHLVKFFVKNYPNYNIINIDNLTYAGNLNNLKKIEDQPNYRFIKQDICNFSEIKKIFIKEKIDSVIHLAAESHVDRSISDPFSFAKTNVLGTLSLLEASKICWNTNFKNNTLAFCPQPTYESIERVHYTIVAYTIIGCVFTK